MKCYGTWSTLMIVRRCIATREQPDDQPRLLPRRRQF